MNYIERVALTRTWAGTNGNCGKHQAARPREARGRSAGSERNFRASPPARHVREKMHNVAWKRGRHRCSYKRRYDCYVTNTGRGACHGYWKGGVSRSSESGGRKRLAGHLPASCVTAEPAACSRIVDRTLAWQLLCFCCWASAADAVRQVLQSDATRSRVSPS